jgi:hypothetical protein
MELANAGWNRRLSPGVELIGSRAHQNMAEAWYTIDRRIQVTVGWAFGASGPTYLEMQGWRGGDMAIIDRNDALRHLPIGHARSVLRPYIEEWALARARKEIGDLPKRTDTEEQYQLSATAYRRLVELGVVRTNEVLSQWSGASVETWTARVRRMRRDGLL